MAGFNLAVLVDDQGLCLQYDGTLRVSPLGAGRHVLSTDRDLDDPSMPEKQIFDRLPPDLVLPSEKDLLPLLASHEGERPICKHGEKFGTVSSTLYVAGGRLLHAEGPPCRTPYRPVHRP